MKKFLATIMAASVACAVLSVCVSAANIGDSDYKAPNKVVLDDLPTTSEATSGDTTGETASDASTPAPKKVVDLMDTNTGVVVALDANKLAPTVKAVEIKTEKVTETFQEAVKETVTAKVETAIQAAVEVVAQSITENIEEVLSGTVSDSVAQSLASADPIALEALASVEFTPDTIQVRDVFDISVVDQDDVKINDFGKVDVTLPCEDDTVNAAIYYDDVNGDVDIMPATCVNGYASFATNHFSYYALATLPQEVVDVLAVTIPDDEEDSTIDADDDTTDDTTVDDEKNVATGVVVAVIPAAVAGVVALVARKRK